jgi:hypothetical protein
MRSGPGCQAQIMHYVLCCIASRAGVCLKQLAFLVGLGVICLRYEAELLQLRATSPYRWVHAPSWPAGLTLLRFTVAVSSIDTPSCGIVTGTTTVSPGSVMVTAVVLAAR